MNEIKLTNEARTARRDYFKEWSRKHPENVKAYHLRKWEKKAKTIYGNDYQPPPCDGVLSEQARRIRNEYYKEYRRTHPETVEKATRNYWERKAKGN